LREWVTREGATRTIEIGLGYGVSARAVGEGPRANGDDGVRHVVIDPFQETRFAGRGLDLLDEWGLLELVEHHADESQIVLPRLLAEGHRFHLAFVDGNHRFDAVFVDF
jgi:predicted O-methyltransferase YrrM